VVEIAHKDNHRRRCSGRLKSNSRPDQVWVLCPTCHRLIDRGFATITTGGIVMTVSREDILKRMFPKLPDVVCEICSTLFTPKRRKQKYCCKKCQRAGRLKTKTDYREKNKVAMLKRSAYLYMTRKNGGLDRHRACKKCGKDFVYENGSQAKRYCSSECFKAAQKEKQRSCVQAYVLEHGARYSNSGKDRTVFRFIRKNPDIPYACQSCGENRIVEISHKPSRRRGGRKLLRGNSDRNDVWLLCPTCHELIDRMGYDPKELGLIE